MTVLLKPADASWMRPIKASYLKKWNHWLVNAPKSYSAAGSAKSPGYDSVIEWISEIWLESAANSSARSFGNCVGVNEKHGDKRDPEDT